MNHFVDKERLLQAEGAMAEVVIFGFLVCAIAALLFDICYVIWK